MFMTVDTISKLCCACSVASPHDSLDGTDTSIASAKSTHDPAATLVTYGDLIRLSSNPLSIYYWKYVN